MLQVAIVLQPEVNETSKFEDLTPSIFSIARIDSQVGLSQIANDLGLSRTVHNNAQEILVVNISHEICSQNDFDSLITMLKGNEKDIDFIILQQSGQAFEISDFIEEFQIGKEEWQRLFINLVEKDNRIFSIGMEAWGLADLCISSNASHASNKLEELCMYHIGSPIKSLEKVAFGEAIYKVSQESQSLHPEGMENPFGVYRLIKQV